MVALRLGAKSTNRAQSRLYRVYLFGGGRRCGRTQQKKAGRSWRASSPMPSVTTRSVRPRSAAIHKVLEPAVDLNLEFAVVETVFPIQRHAAGDADVGKAFVDHETGSRVQ